MSNGPEEELELPFQPSEITVPEFLSLWRDIHIILQKRADAAKKRSDKKPSDAGLVEKYVQSLKELYAFMRLVNIAGNLGQEVQTLQDLLIIAQAEKENPFMFSTEDSKKNKPN